MTLREFALSRLQLFFILVTLILAATAVMGAFITPQQEIHYYHLFSPIVIAALCVLPTCVTYYRREPTVRQYILRESLQLVLIEAVVLLILSPPSDGSITPAAFYVILGAVVLVIYVLATLMMWFQKSRQSKKLTEQLKQLQSSQK